MGKDWTGNNKAVYAYLGASNHVLDDREENDFSDFVDVERYKGRLKINKRGDLYSIISDKILKPSILPNGYIAYVIMLKNPRRTKTEYQHRLLAETFIPNPENKKTVNHIDGNKKNNSLQNLEWATQSENNIHALKTGLRHSNYAEIVKIMHNKRIYSEDDVRFIKEMKNKMSAKDILNVLGKGSKYLIYDIWKGKIYKDILEGI